MISVFRGMDDEEFLSEVRGRAYIGPTLDEAARRLAVLIDENSYLQDTIHELERG